MSLAELELSVRATNCLESEGITTVRDLVIRTDEELLEVRNFGETTLREVKQKLTERGLALGMKIAGAAVVAATPTACASWVPRRQLPMPPAHAVGVAAKRRMGRPCDTKKQANIWAATPRIGWRCIAT